MSRTESSGQRIPPPPPLPQITLGYLRHGDGMSTPWCRHQLWCLLEYPHQGDIRGSLLRQHCTLCECYKYFPLLCQLYYYAIWWRHAVPVDSATILFNLCYVLSVLVLVQWFLFQFVIFSWCPERYVSFWIPVSGGSRKLTRMIKYLLIYYYSS